VSKQLSRHLILFDNRKIHCYYWIKKKYLHQLKKEVTARARARRKMKTDLYLKTVLTVIALCLVILVIQFSFLFQQEATAQSSTMKVDIVAIDGNSFSGTHAWSLTALPVRIRE